MATIDVSKVPGNISIKNITDEAKNINLFPDNSLFTLNKEDELVIRVQTSREFLYYYNVCKEVGLELAEVSEG